MKHGFSVWQGTVISNLFQNIFYTNPKSIQSFYCAHNSILFLFVFFLKSVYNETRFFRVTRRINFGAVSIYFSCAPRGIKYFKHFHLSFMLKLLYIILYRRNIVHICNLHLIFYSALFRQILVLFLIKNWLHDGYFVLDGCLAGTRKPSFLIQLFWNYGVYIWAECFSQL